MSKLLNLVVINKKTNELSEEEMRESTAGECDDICKLLMAISLCEDFCSIGDKDGEYDYFVYEP